MKLTKEEVEGIKNRLDEANRGKSSGWLCVLYGDLADVCGTALALYAELEKAEVVIERIYYEDDVDFAELHEKYAMLLDKGITGAEETRAELAEVREDRAAKTKALIQAFRKLSKTDEFLVETTEVLDFVLRKQRKTQAKLAELREAVAWYFECCDTICSFSDRKLVCNNTLLCYEKAPKLLPKSCPACNSMDEIWKNKRRAEQELRLAGGEDA